MSQETEEEENSKPSSPKCIRKNISIEVAADDDLDDNEEALARSLPPIINSRSMGLRRDDVGQIQEREREFNEQELNEENDERGCLLLLLLIV